MGQLGAWNFADVWEAIADVIPDAPAQVQGPRRATWAEFDRRADGIAATLLAAGLKRQDKVAHYLYNCPEYLESMFGMFKAGLVPINTNYRYGDDELVYLWDNADAVAVVFHGAFTDRIDAIRGRLPRITTWLWVDDGSGPCPPWALPYEHAAAAAESRTVAPWGRSGDDLYMLYTGGTTGMPNGVMWRQDDLFVRLNSASMLPFGEEADLDRLRELVQAPGLRQLPAAPLMHGTGCFTALGILTNGGAVVLLENRTFDPVELLDTVEREAVNAIAWVGDAFARPVLRALDAKPGGWDLSSVTLVVSSGVMWSEAAKQGLLRHHPNMLLADMYASSEALGMGAALSTGGGTTHTASFQLGETARVVTDDGRDVVPGSGEVGQVAVAGRQPLGYYKDEAKTAATFVEIDGMRYSVPGDYATVATDGSITLLGRGSVCINTGGEKVFPEEVEEALKEHPDVQDAVAVGVPDDKFGEAVTAVVEPAPGAEIDEAALIAHVKGLLAPFKAPKRIVTVETIARAPNGKVDYRRLKALAADRLGGIPITS